MSDSLWCQGQGSVRLVVAPKGGCNTLSVKNGTPLHLYSPPTECSFWPPGALIAFSFAITSFSTFAFSSTFTPFSTSFIRFTSLSFSASISAWASWGWSSTIHFFCHLTASERTPSKDSSGFSALWCATSSSRVSLYHISLYQVCFSTNIPYFLQLDSLFYQSSQINSSLRTRPILHVVQPQSILNIGWGKVSVIHQHDVKHVLVGFAKSYGLAMSFQFSTRMILSLKSFSSFFHSRNRYMPCFCVMCTSMSARTLRAPGKCFCTVRYFLAKNKAVHMWVLNIVKHTMSIYTCCVLVWCFNRCSMRSLHHDDDQDSSRECAGRDGWPMTIHAPRLLCPSLQTWATK